MATKRTEKFVKFDTREGQVKIRVRAPAPPPEPAPPGPDLPMPAFRGRAPRLSRHALLRITPPRPKLRR